MGTLRHIRISHLRSPGRRSHSQTLRQEKEGSPGAPQPEILAQSRGCIRHRRQGSPLTGSSPFLLSPVLSRRDPRPPGAEGIAGQSGARPKWRSPSARDPGGAATPGGASPGGSATRPPSRGPLQGGPLPLCFSCLHRVSLLAQKVQKASRERRRKTFSISFFQNIKHHSI